MATTTTYAPTLAPPTNPPALDHPPLIRKACRLFGITLYRVTITTTLTLTTTAVGLTRSASTRVVRTLHVLGARVLSTVAWFVWPTDSTPNKE